jgi:mono/diheme cytochrome c family protein
MKPDRKKGQSKQGREVHPPARSHADDPEPSAVEGTLPVSIFIVLALGLFCGMVYLDNHAGGFNPVVYRPYISSNQVASLTPLDPAQKSFFAGQGIYSQTCFACHQSSGLGTPGMYPPLAGSEWVNEPDPSRMIRIMLDGLTGPITVKAQQWPGTTLMPGFRGVGPSDEDLANIATFVRKSWGNNAPAVTPEQVKAVKEATANHAGRSWTAAELLQVQLKQ